MLALVTTAPSGDFAEALELAGRCGLIAQPRADRTIAELLRDARGAPVLVLAQDRADLHQGGTAPDLHQGGTALLDPPGVASFRASPGLALLRLVRAELGELDPLVRAAQLRPGDRVIDATLGLGGDALVAAHATRAPVLGLEASPVLAAFTQAALRRLPARHAAAAAQVEVRCGDHLAALRAMPSRSADVVLFDPMFRAAGQSAPLFALVRAYANPAPLSAESLHEARRVARRGVLVKDAGQGAELLRLGLHPVPARRLPRIIFGWSDPWPG